MDGANNPPEQWGVDSAVTIVVRPMLAHHDEHNCANGDTQVHPVQQDEDEMRHLLIQRADTGDPYR